MKNDEKTIYMLPPNFIDTARWFGGGIKARNFMEGVAIVATIIYPLFRFLNISGKNKIIVLIVVGLPLMFLFIMGINGDSVTQFASYWLKFKRQRRIAKYNPHIRVPDNYGTTNIGARELPRDRILKLIGKISNDDYDFTGAPVDALYDEDYTDLYFDDDDGSLENLSSAAYDIDEENDYGVEDIEDDGDYDDEDDGSEYRDDDFLDDIINAGLDAEIGPSSYTIEKPKTSRYTLE